VIEFLMYLLFGAALGPLADLRHRRRLDRHSLLGVWFGLDQQIAQGTALVMVVPNVMLALWRYHQRNRIELRHALPLASMGLFRLDRFDLGGGIDAQTMRIGFVAFWCSVGLQPAAMFGKRTASARCVIRGRGWVCWRGVRNHGRLFGVGGAVVATPVLTSLFGTTQVVAQGLSLALALPSTGVTLVTYAGAPSGDWMIGVPWPSVVWRASVGVKVAHAMPELCAGCSAASWCCVR
jgi:uncharacterized membrane protein YfcA